MKKSKEEQMTLADFQKKLFWIFLVITSAIVITSFSLFYYRLKIPVLRKKPHSVLVVNNSGSIISTAYLTTPSDDLFYG